MSRARADQTVFHAIADPTRRAILDVLRDREMTVTALMAAVESPAATPPRRRTPRRAPRSVRRLGQSAFSQHLAVLRNAGLVGSRRQGRSRVYTFQPQPLREVMDWITAYDRFWTEKLGALGRYLDRSSESPPKEAGS